MEKEDLKKYFDANAAAAHKWHARSRYYYNDLKSFFCLNIEPGAKVLEIGSGTGELLAAVGPSRGLGIDLSAVAARLAKEKYQGVEFVAGDIDAGVAWQEKFDYVIISDLIGYLEDIEKSFLNLKAACTPRTRLIVTHYNNLWWPALKAAEFLGLKQKQPIVNWIGGEDIKGLLRLAGFEVVRRGRRLLFPKYLPLVSWFLNKVIANLPLLNYLCLTEYLILRPEPEDPKKDFSVSVIIPARNEKGNIEDAVLRTPAMGAGTEIIFVEGNSTDDTMSEINRVVAKYGGERNIKALKQDGRGKGDAVRKGFEAASGEILMILDADLTVPPEDLPRFYEIMRRGRAEYVHGTRLVYPMERAAMQFLNYLANKFFGLSFSWVLGQYLTDTLCGTKVLFKADYEKIKANRKFFGEFDPFGDFDLIFGASKLNLKIVEIPIHYRERKYGQTNISRFSHGLLLFKMLAIGIKKFKLT